MGNHLITWMVTLPMLGAMLQAFVPQFKGLKPSAIAKWSALLSSSAASFIGILLVLSMRGATAEIQASESLSWVGSYAISYDMGVDGLNALIILLIALVFPVLIAYEWDQKVAPRWMHGLFLILQTSFFGAACAQDLFLLFFFWGLSSFPIYFLIGIWGGAERETAAFRSMVANSLGNGLFFCALVLVYYAVDPHTFLIRELGGGHLGAKNFILFGEELSVSKVAFGLIGLALAFRGPIWPFQGWFTKVAAEAPASVFVVISGITAPVALYIFIRLSYTLFPETLQMGAPIIVTIGVLNLVMGGVSAAAQRSLSGLLAFLCLSEVGMVLIGIGSMNPAGVVGAVYQVLALGLGVTGFGLISGILFDRLGDGVFVNKEGETRFGGIAVRAPAIAVMAGMVIASLLGFPGFGGFVSHALVTIGSYSTRPIIVAVAAFALLLANYYVFMMYRHIFFGKPSAASQDFEDLTWRERFYLFPIVVGLLFSGVYPRPLLDLVRPTVLTLLSVAK